jgi:alkylhydroperoxidase AhpD family core domain
MTAFQKTYRRITLLQTYSIYWRALRAIPSMKNYRRSEIISQQFSERLMLAVTEVNGCAVCSYAHAKMALEAGLTEKEINAMLSGMNEDVPAEERPAVLFAQHYAETKGRPSQLSLDKMEKLYGKQKTDAVLCAIQVIMLGNTFGIPLGALAGRLRHTKHKNGPATNLGYEIMMLLALIVFLPFCAVTALLAAVLHAPRTAVQSKKA